MTPNITFTAVCGLLKLIKRPLDLGGLVGECNNIRGESELRGDSSLVSTPCAMWGGL